MKETIKVKKAEESEFAGGGGSCWYGSLSEIVLVSLNGLPIIPTFFILIAIIVLGALYEIIFKKKYGQSQSES